MNKANNERIEMIKTNGIIPMSNVHRVISKQNLDFLIEQAERVQELEKEIEDWRKEVTKWQRFFREESQQNKRLREALKNIYELAEYDEYDNTLEQIVSEVEKSIGGGEMSKERLENAIDTIWEIVNTVEVEWGIEKSEIEDVAWIISQAERVQELETFKEEMENRYKIWHIGAKKALAEKEELVQQNKRLREALEEISEMRIAYADMAGAKRTAQQALEGE